MILEKLVPEKPKLRGVMHLVFFVLSFPSGVLIVMHAPSGSIRVTVALYAITMSEMLGVSALLHRRNWSAATAVTLTRLDHTTIYLFIAGTYLPIIWIVLHGWVETTMLAVIGTCTLLGIVTEWIPQRPSKTFIIVLFLTLGWIALLALPQIIHNLDREGVLLIAGGGVLYTLGAICLARHQPDPWPTVFGYHEVFHTLVVLALILQYIAIYAVVLPSSD